MKASVRSMVFFALVLMLFAGSTTLIWAQTTPTQEQIRVKAKEYAYDLSETMVYDVVPTYSPYTAGKVSQKNLQSALNAVNLMRYIAGLPDDVELSEEYVNYAQHGAVLMAASEFSHYPSQPADMPDDFYQLGLKGTSSSNIGWGYSNIVSSVVRGYMSDSDAGNIGAVGHRQWILSPDMKKIGFGMAGRHTATYVFDDSRSEQVTNDFFCWPAQNMPYEIYDDVYDSRYAFSVALSSSYRIPDAGQLTVDVTSKLKKQSWHLTTTNQDIDNFLNISPQGYGGWDWTTLVFNVLDGKFDNGDEVRVVVSGLEKQGVPATVDYTVNFFSLEPRPLGDLNDDGKTDISDLMMLAQAVNGRTALTAEQSTAADVTGDGKADIADLMKLAQFVNGKIDTLD